MGRGKKKFSADKISEALESAGVPSAQATEVIDTLNGVAPAPRTRGVGAPSEATPSFSY